jgi:hypothetical protein
VSIGFRGLRQNKTKEIIFKTLTISKEMEACGSICYSGNKLFNKLSPNIKSLNLDINIFKPALKEYLLSPSFVEELTLTKNSQLS